MLRIAQGTNVELLRLAAKSSGILFKAEAKQALHNVLSQVSDLSAVDMQDLHDTLKSYVPGYWHLGHNYVCIEALKNLVPMPISFEAVGVRALPKPEPPDFDVPDDIDLLTPRVAQREVQKVLAELPESGPIVVDDIDALFQHVPGFHCVWKWNLEINVYHPEVDGGVMALLIDSNLGHRAGIQRTRREHSYG